MRSPLRPLPAAVTRWTAAARVLGWLDALAAYLAIWGGAAVAFPSASRASLAVLAAAVTALGALLRPLRVRWRPVRGAVALVLSARLSPGDQAWYVRPGHAERVLVTARHRTRVVIARLNDEGAEGLSVRRTRVLLVPADSA
ncbi:MAG: hypothetical protein DMD97_00060 [Candidatus Rokuibacteriota bacterium]|nr:MAG: hypothetical protein DMD97_00060 [Candidatus Rokubacteria bacterium]